MKCLIITICALLMVGSGIASAQGHYDEIYYPGSIWSNLGTVSPVEKGNVISMTHFEQGVAYKGAELFSQTTLQMDSNAFDWNRRTILGVGGRYTYPLPHGVVRANISYLSEKRYISGSLVNGMSLMVDCWFGWNARKMIH